MSAKRDSESGMTMTRRLLTGALIAALLFTLTPAIVGCGGEGEAKNIEIGWIPWDEDVAVTYLWKNILEGEGYTVTLTQLDVAPVYAGLAQGDLDLFLDAWLPVTHEDYWEQYGDQLEDIKIWYDKGTLELSVPDYVEDVNSIADLKGKADAFGGQIVGIEPGAGLMRKTREDVMPGYELDGFTLVEGSTPGMLAELERAINANEPIVVTLWHPHWAYAAYEIKDLEDPENLFGGSENLHVLGRDGFESDFPEVAGWLANFEMADEELATLENLVIQDYETGQEEQAVEEWLSDESNQQLVDGWLGK
jgi:glycine betaine/proline transport system substrate-binding protein